MISPERLQRPRGSPKTTGANVKAVLAVFTLSLLALAVFRSADMVSRAYDLPEDALTAPLVSAAVTWNGWMEEVGTTQMSEDIALRVEAFTQDGFASSPDEMGED